MVADVRPDDPEVTGLLALLVLTEARRPARTGPHGELVPLAQQDRSRWDRSLVREGVELITAALRQQRTGPYQLQAAIAAVHDQAPTYADTSWADVLALYDARAQSAPSPIVAVNRAIAVAMVHGPDAGHVVLDTVAEPLDGLHRYHAVRAHLLELAGRVEEARHEYDLAIERVTNLRERTHLQARRAGLR